MRYNSINSCECTNGLGWGVSLFVQGCPIKCKGCFNPETWDFYGGKDFGQKEVKEILQLLKPKYISRFSLLGGEPLCSANIYQNNLLVLSIKINFPKTKIWVWTGYTWDQLQNNTDKNLKTLLENIDYLVAGPFIQEEKDLSLKWRGSRNQEIIDVQESIKQKKKILYEN